MLIRKYRSFIVIAFLGIFASKMIISVAPVVFSAIDKGLMNAVIMQIEVENNGDEAQKKSLKFSDHKFLSFNITNFKIVLNCSVSNSFIEHSGRYVDPYHPSVPTPPPNFS